MQALSFAVHIPIVCFGIAFPAFVLMLEGLWLRTGDPIYRLLHRSAQVLPPRDLPLSAPDPSEVVMAEIAKIIRVIGQSPTSFAEAAQVAVREAAKTVRDIHGVHVIEMSAIVENDEITMFRTTVDIAFGVER